MILTVTMNPSVDISYYMDSLSIDKVNRCHKVRKTAGGKGLNVTRVINQMDEQVVATGLLGGSLGRFVEESLDNEKISHFFSEISGNTRNCIAILHDSGKQTEILESGPSISKQEISDFENSLLSKIEEVDVVTISGSLPNGVRGTFYEELLGKINRNKVKTILDTSGSSLKCVLKSKNKPYAIKPNLEELQELTGKKIKLDEQELVTVLSDSLFTGIPLILVSLGEKGAFVKFNTEFYKVNIPKIDVLNPVGSGDSTVAGLAIAISKNESIENVIKTAMTLGILNTKEEQTGYIDKNQFSDYFNQITVNKVE